MKLNKIQMKNLIQKNQNNLNLDPLIIVILKYNNKIYKILKKFKKFINIMMMNRNNILMNFYLKMIKFSLINYKRIINFHPLILNKI